MADHDSLNAADRRISPESPEPEPPQPIQRISLGPYDENWVEYWQHEMFVYHQLMTNRLVTTFYGHYPENNAEMCLFRYVLQLFNRIKPGLLKRVALARRLEDTIDSEKKSDPEGDALLSWLNIYLSGRIQSFKKMYELLSKFTQAEADENEEVTAFLDDLKTHSEAFKNAAYAEMIEDACESVRKINIYIEEDEAAIERVSIRDTSIPEEDEDAAGDENEVVVKEDEANADEEHEAVGEKNDDDDKMDAGDDDKKVAGEGDKGDDDKMVTDKDDSGEEDKKVTKDDTSDEDKMVTDKGDTSDDVDKIMTDKDDTSDDVERIMTDKDDTSDDNKMVAENDDAGDEDQAVGDKKHGKAGKDDKTVTKQDDSDSESGWC